MTDLFDHNEMQLLREGFLDEAHSALADISRLLSVPSPNTEDFDTMLRLAHSIKGSAAIVGFDNVSGLLHNLESKLQELRTQTPVTVETRRDFDEALDAIRLALTPDSPPELIDGAEDQLERVTIAHQENLPTDQTSVDMPEPSMETLHISRQQVSELLDLTGELVFDRTRIQRKAEHLRAVAKKLSSAREDLRDVVPESKEARRHWQREKLSEKLRHLESIIAGYLAELERLTLRLVDDTEALRITANSIQQGLFETRVIQVGRWLNRLLPSYRQTARSQGKQVDITVTGGNTQVDIFVANQLTTVVTQLVRNCLAHGIELPEVRAAAGKAATGHISIEAVQSRGGLVLVISDDGAGINTEKITGELISQGFWSEERAMRATQADVFQEMFRPGLSTKAGADQVAGRGIGLDETQRRVTSLGGNIRVTSAPSKGTVFTIKVPGVTSVGQAMLFKVDGDVFAVDQSRVLGTVVASGPPSWQGNEIPLVKLRNFFGRAPKPGPWLVIKEGKVEFAVQCDKIVGPREILVKPVPALLSGQTIFAGATVSGSGKVQLILDTATLASVIAPEKLATASLTDLPTSKLSGESPRVLVVDDSRAAREAIARVIHRKGWIADTAVDGQQAWRLLKSHNYAVVVTDLEMPVMDGAQLLDTIRRHARYKALTVAVVTSLPEARARQKLGDLEADLLMQKPVTRKRMEPLLELISEAMD